MKKIKVKLLRGVGYNGLHLAPGAVVEMEEKAVIGLLKYKAVELVEGELTPLPEPTAPAADDTKKVAPTAPAADPAVDTVEPAADPAVDTVVVETPEEGLAVFDFLKEEQVAALIAAGFNSIESIKNAAKKDLENVTTVGDVTVERLVAAAAELEVVEG